jgi:hypothetical protein
VSARRVEAAQALDAERAACLDPFGVTNVFGLH